MQKINGAATVSNYKPRRKNNIAQLSSVYMNTNLQVAMSGIPIGSMRDSFRLEHSEKRKKSTIRNSTLLNQGFTGERPPQMG